MLKTQVRIMNFIYRKMKGNSGVTYTSETFMWTLLIIAVLIALKTLFTTQISALATSLVDQMTSAMGS